MDFTELYAQKKMTAAQAAALVKSGDWVDYGWAVYTPVAVDAEIAKRLPELEGVNFRGGILMWVPAIFQIDDPAAHMTWNSWHMGGIERKAIAQGFSFYSPIRYSELRKPGSAGCGGVPGDPHGRAWLLQLRPQCISSGCCVRKSQEDHR